MSNETFFNETSEQSAVKTTIVSKYFWAWSKVIIPTAKRMRGQIAYIDLFAGPGRYKDGTKSTPIMVLEKAVVDADLSRMLVTVFNDKDDTNTQSLDAEIQALPGIEKLKHKPQVYNREVGTEIVKLFDAMREVPALFFIDPWGYKGLSLQLVNAAVRDWGCDCVFFFNYNRIKMGLTNDAVREHMDALFGSERADQLRAKLDPLSPKEKEATIVEAISQALKATGPRHVLPFCFRDNRGSRTSHHLIFVSKSPKGYGIMKEIMANASSTADQGVASFQYCPADERHPFLFEMSRPLDDLESMLLSKFAGRRLTVQSIHEEHNVGTPYIMKNYKAVLLKLEAEGRITVESTKGKKRKKNTMADHLLVSFPAGGR